jgi:hypothetical protein
MVGFSTGCSNGSGKKNGFSIGVFNGFSIGVDISDRVKADFSAGLFPRNEFVLVDDLVSASSCLLSEIGFTAEFDSFFVEFVLKKNTRTAVNVLMVVNIMIQVFVDRNEVFLAFGIEEFSTTVERNFSFVSSKE